MIRFNSVTTACIAAMLAASPSAVAVDFNWSGFMTLGLGKTLSGSVQGQNEVGIDCPCMIADYSQAAVYENSWDIKPDSKLGLQGTMLFSDELSLTGQVVSRGSRDFEIFRRT